MQSQPLALLVLDVQNDIVDGHGRTPWMKRVLATIADLIAAARRREVPVVYVRVAFRPSYADVFPNRPSIKERSRLKESTRGTEIVDELRPGPLDALVTKRRTGAFYMTDLELLLRNLGTKTLIVTGVSTARAVESTVREAHSRDFECVVVSDGCLANSEQLHENALLSMSDFFARIATGAEVRATYFTD